MCRYMNGGNCECPYTMSSVCDNPSDCENLETNEKGVENQMKLEEKVTCASPLQDYFHHKITVWSDERELKIAVPQLEEIKQLLLSDLLLDNLVLVGIKEHFEYEDEDGEYEKGTLFTFKEIGWKIEEGKEPFKTFLS